MVAGGEGADRGGKLRCRRDRERRGPAICIVPAAAVRLASGRASAVGRLFAESDGGAEHWAVVASLNETCKLKAVEPLGYLADVLTRIVDGHPNSQIDDFLPWANIDAPEVRAVA